MIYFVILFFKLGFTSAKIKQATTEPIAMDARYSSGLPIVGSIGGNGEVKNLQLVDVDYDVKQAGPSGGIARDNYGTITACSVTGTIAAARGSVGGIAANNRF